MSRPEFVAFDKIPRLNREIVITEKIDGTNAQVCVTEDGQVYAGSRNRWNTPEDDNYGFAKWVKAHENELRTGLGTGTHYGEWWGAGIQRGYSIKEKRFSLFNVARWTNDVRPKCCHVVPTLYKGPFDKDAVEDALGLLQTQGSMASPGFLKPEGVVVYHKASNQLFKATLDGDEAPKSLCT